MIQTKQFSGIMNLDDEADVLPFLHHMEARNVVFRGNGANMRAQNIQGNVIINNSELPVGTNICIGAWYDQVRGRIFFFLYNSNGNHGIYLYTPATGVLETVLQCGILTTGDILKFDIQKPIFNVNIIYGDTTQGDTLFWINSQNKPCKINLKRTGINAYIPYEESYLDVATAPAQIPPSVVYEDDPSITVNNLRKRLFKFKYRWVYEDNPKSTTSIQSEIPLPYDPFETSIDTDPIKNARIVLIYQTGPPNVKKIELLASLSLGTQFSDFFLIASIDKTTENIPDNDISVFNFYNEQAYNYIDVEESNQLFDYVPLQAIAQETLNGNVLTYGDITEGYPNLTNFSNGTITSNIQSLSTPSYDGRYFSLLIANQSGDSGFGTGAIHIMVKGKGYTDTFPATIGNMYIIKFTDATSVEYTSIVGDTIIEVLQGLINDAISKGFTVSGSTATPDLIYFTKSGVSLAYYNVIVNGLLENIENTSAGSLNAYDWWSRYSFGLVYFDQKGRTNGVVYTDGFAIETIGYQDFLTISNIPKLTAAIYHRPPDWAYYYTWVRTKNLTKSFFLQWISERTFKDTSIVAGEKAFAYISIESLNAFKSRNPDTPLSYDFTPNDRIRFIKRYNLDGTTANVYNSKDFEIQSQVINPIINGVQQNGQFIKIFLPATDVTFDFGGDAYAFYFIELYTPAQSVANGLNVYFEFGERYAIGNPTLSTRFHQGESQNQTTNLVIPAIFNFIKGDNYTRYRIVQTGGTADYTIGATNCLDGDAGRITLGATFIGQTVSDPNVTYGSSPCNNLLGFDLATNTDRDIIQIGTGTFNFRLKGAVSITFADTLPGDIYEFFVQRNDGQKFQLVAPFDSSGAGTYNFTYDITFSMTTGQRLFIFGWSVVNSDHTRSFSETSFTITRVQAITQTVIDPNFSDFYPSSVNSNGRPFVFDENANQVTYPVLMRWSLNNQEDSNINRTNRFYFQNSDTLDKEKGSIQRFKTRERVLRIFQERGCGQVGIFSRFIQNNDGQTQLITTNVIITSDNVQYYQGEYGIGLHPESLVSGTIQDYFVDYTRGYQMRLSGDGLTPISELYKGQYAIRNLLTPYNKIWNRPDGGLAKILGVYDFFEEEYITILQSGTNGSNSINNYVFSFNEKRNGYSSFRDYVPEWMVCAEDVLYSWLNGQMYIHNSNTYCNFFGQQFGASIVCAFNQNLLEKKTWISIAEVANTIWDCPVIYSNLMSYGTQRQETTLVPAEFSILEQMPSASFKRDIHSIGGKINGSPMKGNFIVIHFQKANASELVYLSQVAVKFIDSPLTAV